MIGMCRNYIQKRFTQCDLHIDDAQINYEIYRFFSYFNKLHRISINQTKLMFDVFQPKKNWLKFKIVLHGLVQVQITRQNKKNLIQIREQIISFSLK